MVRLYDDGSKDLVSVEANRIRLFAIDVDGTLLDRSHRLRTEVKEAVCRLPASGFEVALATARGPQAVREIVQQFNFVPWLIVNLQPEISAELLSDSAEPSKIMLISRWESASRLLPRIENSIRSVCTGTFSKPNYLEVLPLAVNKAGALAALTQSLGISLEQVAAIGDGLNDLEMLNAVGLPVAMGNAVDLLKSKAKWIVRTNDEGGVAEAAERILRER